MWKYNTCLPMCELLMVGDKVYVDTSDDHKKPRKYICVEITHIYHTDWMWKDRPCDTDLSISTYPSEDNTVGYHPARIKEVDCSTCHRRRSSYVEV